MIPLVVIRPQPGCDATVAAARGRGLDARGFPLFSVGPLQWSPPDPAAIDAVLIGSANALRHGGDDLARYRGKPAYAVGKATAEAARTAGFSIAATGEGGLQSLLGALDPHHKRLLRLSGDVRVMLSPPEDVSIVERVVYESRRLPMSRALADLLQRPAVVLLHSAHAALHFASLCDLAHLERSRISLAAIGPRVAEVVGGGWRAVVAAARPDDAALLALAQEMCQTPPGVGTQDET